MMPLTQLYRQTRGAFLRWGPAVLVSNLKTRSKQYQRRKELNYAEARRRSFYTTAIPRVIKCTEFYFAVAVLLALYRE